MGPAVISPDLPPEAPVRSDLDSYGGWLGLKGKATGFFHTEQLGGRWWLITPEGNAFFMLQIGWAKKKDSARLKSWGFNTSEEDTGMPYAVDVRFFRDVKRLFPIPQLPGAPPWWTFPDVFDPEWPQHCKERAQAVLGSRAQDPLMIGYFMENEVCLQGWYEAVTHAAKDAPCRAAFVEVARAYYAGKPDDLARDWQAFRVKKVEDLLDAEGDAPNIPDLKAAWEAAVAERAFSVAASAAKAVDPNHLNLGLRLFNAPLPSPGILAAMGKYCDVISLNLYSILPDRLMTPMFTLIPALSAITGRPTLTSEFSYRGGDTLHPNTMGALPTVRTQAEREIGYLSYVAAMASLPSHVGVSWYKYPDDDPEARWNGYAEDCNFGVVDNEGRPYAVLTEAMRATNSVIYELAADPVQSKSCPLFYRTELMRWDRPGDAVLFQRLMQSSQPFVDPLAEALPEPRRYHESYWIRHKSPGLTINDDRFVGWCQANLVHAGEDGTTLVLINVQALAWFPRAFWLGRQCSDPDKQMTLESNAQFLLRKLDANGRLRRLTMADGSFLRADFAPELRVDRRIPYLDLQFNTDAKELTLITRGNPKRIGVSGVQGWKTTWNGAPLAGSNISESDGLTVFSLPQ
jgi:agarase